jgi:hypothetical protein
MFSSGALAKEGFISLAPLASKAKETQR